jgi:hypothetical protein
MKAYPSEFFRINILLPAVNGNVYETEYEAVASKIFQTLLV